MNKPYWFLSFMLAFALAFVPFSQTDRVSQEQPTAFQGESTSGLPAGLTNAEWIAVERQIETSRYQLRPGEMGSYDAINQAQALRANFTAQGVNITSPENPWEVNLSLAAYGYEGALHPVSRPKFLAEANRLHYTWDANLSEWWLNTVTGLEQGFSLQHPPTLHPAAAGAALILEMSLQTGLTPTLVGHAVHFWAEGRTPVWIYDKLLVTDVAGRQVPASMRLVNCADASPASSCRLQLVVDDHAAAYPLTVDPVFQQAYVKASNSGSGDHFGNALALSGDTLVVGAYQEDSPATGVGGSQGDGMGNSGAVYVFVRNSGIWSQQVYLKASNTGEDDYFGWAVAISGDTMVVGAPEEGSVATGIDGDQGDNSAPEAGAVYVFVRNSGVWSQQAYVKASNTQSADHFGAAVSVSGDRMAVGAWGEDSSATGIGGSQASNSVAESGAVYTFRRSGSTWSQDAYIKASNTGPNDYFGWALALSGDTLIAGAYLEDSSATGIGGSSNNDASNAGAAYIFVHNGSAWSQQAYVKASNTNAEDNFGLSVAIFGDTAVVGAPGEDSNATESNGNQTDNSVPEAGAVYVFVRNGSAWSQQTYLKASNPGSGDNFGWWVGVSGEMLVVGAPGEDSNATGINGSQGNNLALDAGAAYLLVHSGTAWVQQAYLKASNSATGDQFGCAVAVSGDTLVAGAQFEDSSTTGINPISNEFAADAGAAYAFVASFNLSVSGNGQIIPNGDALPNLADGTDFGDVYLGLPESHTFTISYTHGLTLTVSNIALSGSGAANFDISGISLPATIATDQSASFDVSMEPPLLGVYSATLTMTNDDPDENPYTFVIQGTGVILSPTVSTQAVSTIGVTSATGHGTIVALGATNPTAHGMVWNTTGMPALGDDFSNEGAVTSTGVFTSALTGLAPNTTYFVRAYATNLPGTAYGNQVSFTTAPQPPAVTTQAVGGIGMNSATGNGTIVSLGVPTPTAYGVAWNTSGSPTIGDDFSDLGATTSTGVFTGTLAGLAPNTTYFVRAYATNAAGTVYGNQVSFTTHSQPPQVTTQPVEDIGVTSALGKGAITSLGVPVPTAHGMVWNTTGSPTLADLSSDEGPATVSGAFTSTLNGLNPDTTYFVRAYATNPAGTAYGQVVTFTTELLPPEIDVLGNGLSIPNGSAAPSPTDGTDFGGVEIGSSPVTRTFTIANLGGDELNLTGDAVVVIGGTHAADFQVVAQPESSVAAGGAVTFQVIFTPSAAGLRTATISILNNDGDETPYRFVVQGTGLQAGYRIYLPLAMR